MIKSCKMKYKNQLIALIFCNTALLSCKTHKVALEGLNFEQQLEVLFPKATISPVKINDHFTKHFQLVLKQPLDYNNPETMTWSNIAFIVNPD